MSYVDSLLGSHETVLRRVQRHPLVLARAVVEATVLTTLGVGLALGLGAILPAISPLPAAVAWGLLIAAVAPFVAAIVVLTNEWLRWRSDLVVLTDHRLLSATGILNKSTFDSSLSKINDMRLEVSLLGRIFGYGHLTVLTAAEIDTNDQHMEMLRDAADLKRELLEAKDRLERRDH